MILTRTATEPNHKIMFLKFKSRFCLHKHLVTLWGCIELLLLLQCLIRVVNAADYETSTYADDEDYDASTDAVGAAAAPAPIPYCDTQYLSSEIKSTTGSMLKYLDPCDGKVSENWRKSWLNTPQHRFTGEWRGKVCNLFLFHYCNGTHCVCGNKDIFGVDLKYASMPDSKQTCFAKDMEPCSHHTADFARDLRLNARDKKRAIIRQYFVPSSAWGGNCTAKVNLDCADDMHWCKAVKDKTKKRVFYTRCILKEYPRSGQDRLQLNYETLFVLKSIVIGMNYYHLL